MGQILLRTQVPLCRLHRCVAEQHLNLLKLAARGATQFRAGTASIVRCDAGNAGFCRVLPEHLPDDLLA